MEKTKFCAWHSGGVLCLEMTQHQLQLESWDDWDIVYENLIIKHKCRVHILMQICCLILKLLSVFPLGYFGKAS